MGHQVLHFTHAFHGRSGYTLSLTNTKAEKTKWYAKFPWPRVSTPSIKFPLSQENLPSLIKKEQNAIQEIKSAFVKNKDDICAILIEPILSEGGDLHLRDEFFIQLRELADENEALLIYDEVQTGVGLTGKFWCHEHFGEYAKPDILVFGKKMQVCGILASKRVDEIPSNVFNVSSRINSTWGGNLTDMVRSTKILQIIEEDGLVEKANQTGNFLVEQLKKLTMHSSLIQQVRGKGLQVAFDLPNAQTRDMIIQEGLKNNVLFLACGQKSIRFRPALTIDEREISEGISRLDTILKGISDV